MIAGRLCTAVYCASQSRSRKIMGAPTTVTGPGVRQRCPYPIAMASYPAHSADPMERLITRLPDALSNRLTLPLIVAPMFTISGPDLVIAACRNGVIGAFPTANCRTIDELSAWIEQFREELGPSDAPFCANLIMPREETAREIDLLVRHNVELVLTSVGSPKPAVERFHEAGALVFADVASLRHARRAIESGVDGLVLLSAGAGGQTGWINGMAFVRAVREMFDGTVILSGGVVDGATILGAQTVGYDLAMMGTPFIASNESLASNNYRNMVVTSSIDDVILTQAFTPLPSNMLRPSIVEAGFDPNDLSDRGTPIDLPSGSVTAGAKRWKDIWSAGHSVSSVVDTIPAGERISRLQADYEVACERMRRLLSN